MTLALDDKWIWDSWYAHDGQRWHGYFLQADKSLGDPDLRHFNVTQGHAVSDDLINWEHKGTCLKPAPKPAWDDTTTWTGSVIEGPDGVWHLFYTGGGSAEQGLYQRIGHATSTDMHSWERVGSGLCLDLKGPNAEAYEAEMQHGFWPDRAMRDPFVMKDPEGDGYLMYFTARAPGIAEANAGGAIGFATSPDLYEWTLQPPVFVGDYGQLEVPQIFKVGSRYYCLFCTADEHWSGDRKEKAGTAPVTGNHYLTADNVRGPWTVAPGFLDGDTPCYRYAARVLETNQGLVIMGFADGGKNRFGGYVMDPVPLKLDDDGLLYIEPSDRGK